MGLKTADVCVYLPTGIAGVALSVTAASTAETALPGGSGALRWMFQNAGADRMHYIVGITGVGAAAVATCCFIAAGDTQIFDAPHGLGGALYIRAISVSATGLLMISQVA